ncbi:hypothetical protein P4S72_21425 [Vibrio sp. PP-XX7]
MLAKDQLITDLEHLATARPFMIELAFHDIAELRAATPLLEQMDCRIWVNTLDLSNPLQFSDSQAQDDPEKYGGHSPRGRWRHSDRYARISCTLAQ